MIQWALVPSGRSPFGTPRGDSRASPAVGGDAEGYGGAGEGALPPPVVRYLQLPNQPRPLSVMLPLRVLAIHSEPVDYPRLDLEAEWTQVMASVSEFADGGAITVTDLAAPTLSELRRVLLRERFQVVHYMGHGGFTTEAGGMLLFTDGGGPQRAGHRGAAQRDAPGSRQPPSGRPQRLQGGRAVPTGRPVRRYRGHPGPAWHARVVESRQG